MPSLYDLEKQIDNADYSIDQAYLIKGKALREIAKQRLYKEHYKNFASYVKERFKFSLSQAKHLISTARLSEKVDLKHVANEGQARQIIEAPESLRPALVQLLGGLPDKATARSIAILTETLQELVATGHIYLDEHGQLPIADAIQSGVAQEVYEKYLRKIEHIKSSQQNELVLELINTQVGELELLDILYANFGIYDRVNVKIYRKDSGIIISIKRNNDD